MQRNARGGGMLSVVTNRREKLEPERGRLVRQFRLLHRADEPSALPFQLTGRAPGAMFWC